MSHGPAYEYFADKAKTWLIVKKEVDKKPAILFTAQELTSPPQEDLIPVLRLALRLSLRILFALRWNRGALSMSPSQKQQLLHPMQHTLPLLMG